ncbi:MAG: hypothetical protein V4558_16435 [Gemmatimonadota bacterium]
MLRWLVVLTLLAGAAEGLPAQQGNRYTTTATPDEATLVEVRIGRLASKTMTAYRRSGDALLPIHEVLRLAEIAATDLGPSRLTFRSTLTGEWVILDFAPAPNQHSKRGVRVPAGSSAVLGGEPYISSRFLGGLIGTDLQVDWEDLTVTLLDPDALPIAQRARRDALRQAAALADDATMTPVAIAPAPSHLSGLVIDYAVESPLQHFSTRDASWNLGGGSELLGGGITATLSHSAGGGQRVDASWLKAWPSATGIAQLAIGDAVTTGPHARTARGFAVSNAPLARPDDYGLLPFGGNIAPGWDIEAWRGGRLVAEDSVDASGRFRLDVPVQYGENAVEFVAYGPFGEVRRFSRAWGVHPDAVASGQLIWGLSAGACRSDRCNATLNADLRLGVHRGWTARAGIEQFWRGDAGRLSHPYLALYGAVTPGLDVDLTTVSRAVTQATLTWSPTRSLRTSLTAAQYDTSVVDPLLTPLARRDQVTATIGWRHGATSLDANLERYRSGDGSAVGGRIALSTGIGRLQWLASVRADQSRSGSGPRTGSLTAGLDAFAASLGSGILRRATIRAGIDFSSLAGSDQFRLATGVGVSRNVRIETGVSWRAGQRGAHFTLLMVGDLPSFRTTTSIDQSRTASVQQSVQGSLVVDATRNRVVTRAQPALSRGGLSGRACIDANGDGRCVASEEGVAGLRVVAAGVATTTDADGRWNIWDLTPYTATRVSIDTTSLSAPYLVPPFREAMVTPSANRFVTLDLPLSVGGVVEGTVQRNDGAGVSGLLLRLTRAGSAERISLRTFVDGGFYAVGLRPGTWTLTPDAGELDLLAMTSAAVPIRIVTSPDGAIVDGVRLRLEPRATAAH